MVGDDDVQERMNLFSPVFIPQVPVFFMPPVRFLVLLLLYLKKKKKKKKRRRGNRRVFLKNAAVPRSRARCEMSECQCVLAGRTLARLYNAESRAARIGGRMK